MAHISDSIVQNYWFIINLHSRSVNVIIMKIVIKIMYGGASLFMNEYI